MYRVSHYVICEEECMLEGNSLNTHTHTRNSQKWPILGNFPMFAWVFSDISDDEFHITKNRQR